MPEIMPADVAQIAIDAYRAAGYQVTPVRGDGSRFASFEIKAPTGQVFRIQAEETW